MSNSSVDGKRRQLKSRSQSSEENEDYLYATYLKEYNQPVGPLDFFTGIVRKFNRVNFIILGAYICNVDLMCGQQKACDANSSPWEPSGDGGQAHAGNIKTRPVAVENETLFKKVYLNLIRWIPAQRPRSSWRKSLKMDWITYVIQAFYVTAAFFIILNVVYLYRYHISCLRLRRTRELLRVHGREQRVALDDQLLSDGLESLINVASFIGSMTASDIQVRVRALGSHKVILSLGQLEQVLATHANETRQTLGYLGDALVDWGMLNEIIYLSILFISLSLFAILQLIYLYVNPAGARLHRDIIDSAEEQRRVDECCEAEVLKYLESARVYAAIVSNYNQLFTNEHRQATQRSIMSDLYRRPYLIASYHGHDKVRQVTRQVNKRRKGTRETLAIKRWAAARDTREPYRCRTVTSDYCTCRLLMQLLVAGALRPLNNSKRWIALINLGSALLLFIVPPMCCVFVGALMLMMRISWTPGLDLGLVCMITLVLFNTWAVSFHVVSLFVSCLEQAILVNRNLGLMYDCLHLNKKLFNAYVANTNTSPTSHQVDADTYRPGNCRFNKQELIIDKINSNYLFTLMTYKIFVAQLTPFKRTFRGIFLVALTLAFIVPVLTRFHLTYLQLESSKRGMFALRLGSLITSLSILILTDSICLPMCYMHSHCQRLYKALSSLLAHIVEVQEHEKGMGIYNEHSVTVLLKELADAKQMLERFSVQSLGVGGTFSTLIKAHFWWGLVALSVLINTQDNLQGSMFESFISDPLGVWRFRLI